MVVADSSEQRAQLSGGLMDAEITRRFIGVSILIVSFLIAKVITKRGHMPGNVIALGMVIGFVIALA